MEFSFHPTDVTRPLPINNTFLPLAEQREETSLPSLEQGQMLRQSKKRHQGGGGGGGDITVSVQKSPVQVCCIPELPRLSSPFKILINHEDYLKRGELRLLPELEDPNEDAENEDCDAELAALHKQTRLPSILLRPRQEQRDRSMLFSDMDRCVS